MSTTSIDVLLNLVPDHPDRVLASLQSHRELASEQDAHGYSLVHAAASYNHIALLTALITDYNVEPNIKDEDGETALFNAESVEVAKALMALGVNAEEKNHDGLTAAEKLADEDEQPEVAAFLREAAGQDAAQDGTVADEGVHPPPPLPNGVKIDVGTMQPDEAGEAPDPEFRRRIEELAAREDFQTEEGQRELRNLVQDAVSGLRREESDAPATTRRRMA